jgi:hypothetical protein
MPAATLREFQYVSRYSQPIFGLITRSMGQPVDPDGEVVNVSLIGADGGVEWTRQATRVEEATYEVDLSSVETSEPGLYEVRWTYETGGTPQMYGHPIEIGPEAPAYDELPAGMKGVVESVMALFSDAFDSPLGGPHIQVYFQTHFGRGRVAQLLHRAMGRLNTIAQPHTTYAPVPGQGIREFPLERWGSLLVQSLYVEVIKHLIRSYTEQPDNRNVSVAYLDRRDYAQRWASVLQSEQEDLKDQLDHFKIEHLGLGRSRVLVAGGSFGPNWIHRGMFLNAARPQNYYVRYVG